MESEKERKEKMRAKRGGEEREEDERKGRKEEIQEEGRVNNNLCHPTSPFDMKRCLVVYLKFNRCQYCFHK